MTPLHNRDGTVAYVTLADRPELVVYAAGRDVRYYLLHPSGGYREARGVAFRRL